VAAAGLLLAATACAADIPALHPDLSAAQIAALPGQAGINDAHYVTQDTGPDGTVFSSASGTVQLKPARGFSQLTVMPPGAKGGYLPGEYREINGTAYNQMLAGWSHPRWAMNPPAMGGIAPDNPVYFDTWHASGPFQVEGEEGSAVDRAWRLVAHPTTMKPGATLRVWVRERDGYPLQYRLDLLKGGSTRIVFDRVNSGARVKAPAPQDMIPPPAAQPDAGHYSFAGGVIRVLAVDYAYTGPLASPSVGGRQIGTEVYLDAPTNQGLQAPLTRWELIDVDGTVYRTAVGAAGTFYSNGGVGGDQLAFFSVRNEAKAPFSLHVVLVDNPQNVPPQKQGPAPTPEVVVDAVIKLS